eukprot:maker-scaffold124_size330879-snap-gene-1.22 protein:Tk01483 transcript:maker-scaffold124_size330879-snap-gene-1.22-mRNA-1 annotation:"fasciclin-3 precursor"
MSDAWRRVLAQNLDLSKNHEGVTVSEGEQVDLVCTASTETKGCSFTEPSGEVYSIFEGARYQRGRISHFGNTGFDCGIRISDIKDADNGQWTCTVSAQDSITGDTVRGAGYVNVTVAVAPSSIGLRMDGQDVQGDSITFRLSETQDPVDLECVASDTRPRPTFKWFIDSNPLDGEFVDSEEDGEDGENGKMVYVQTFKYFPNAIHNGQSLRCEVDHMAYSEAQLANNENVVETNLDLFYKPQEPVKEQVFYGLKEGQPHTVTINIQANPQPTEGSWYMFDSEDSGVAFGATSLDERYSADFIQPSESNDGEFEAKLHIMQLTPEMAGQTNKLVVKNTEGTTDYPFKLELGEKPPAEPMGSGPVVGIIVVVIILLLIVVILIVARSKGILCFAPKSGEPLQEEKDGAAFDNVEKGEPLNPKPPSSGGDGKSAPPPAAASLDKSSEPAKAPVATTEAEDKKSNGAQTPV